MKNNMPMVLCRWQRSLRQWLFGYADGDTRRLFCLRRRFLAMGIFTVSCSGWDMEKMSFYFANFPSYSYRRVALLSKFPVNGIGSLVLTSLDVRAL